MDKLKGGCHCGSVQWEFELPIKTSVQCHCSMCRKLSGSDYSSYVVVPKENFFLMKGKKVATNYRATDISYKNFCSKCGSPTHLVNGKHFPDDIVIPLGLVEGFTEELKPKVQVYTSEKVNWICMNELPVLS